MGFMDELKKLTRPYAEDDDDFDEDFDLEEERPVRAARTAGSARPAPRTTARPSGYDDVLDELDGSRTAAPRRSDSGSKVVNIHTTAQMQVVLVKPDRFDSVSDIAEHLRNKKAVVLNLEATNKDVARRLVDFLSGCTYALDGKIKKIAISTYLITPYNMDIIGDLIDELENSGVYL
ncbi:MAG: cell division protein SepF [Oscillospiraceae bacterium]|nr:cell division protein SepF [Oscillospiraceae bacterium]